jgi:hypothetical protein
MTPPASPLPPRKFDPFAAILSYVVPGLGQIYQGRIGKGVLFLVCLYVLFFYGMYLGHGQNVYLVDSKPDEIKQCYLPWKPFGDLENRPHFAGQFWIGMAAWPAILQYAARDPEQPPDRQAKEHRVFGHWMQQPGLNDLNQLQRDGDKRWDLGWVYTVVAGVLNILVIYDALAGPAHREAPKKTPAGKEPVAV